MPHIERKRSLMKKFLIILIVLLLLVIGVEVGYLAYRGHIPGVTEPATTPTTETTQSTTAPTTQATETTGEATTQPTVPSTAATVPSTAAPTEVTTQPTEPATEATEPTVEPTQPPTEPARDENTYLLTFAGNCTLGNTLSDRNNSASFVNTVGEDYGYPFRNVLDYFQKDDFTMVNLEGVFSDDAKPIAKEYTFIGPSAYARILSEGSVDAVSLANDHTKDFGSAGYADTKTSLEGEGICYVEADSSLLFTTERGLKVGVYAVNFTLTRWDMQREIKQLKNKGAEVIVVYFHWGSQSEYYPSLTQINYGHAAIECGADIVIGTNPHVLQPIEYYLDGVICYSLGNFSYGGTKWLSDPDTAFVQVEFVRDALGRVEFSELYIVPCSITSLTTAQNNFQPKPLDSDNWQYNQILRKLSEPIESFYGKDTGSTDPTAAAKPTETTPKPTQPASPDVPDLNDPQA